MTEFYYTNEYMLYTWYLPSDIIESLKMWIYNLKYRVICFRLQTDSLKEFFEVYKYGTWSFSIYQNHMIWPSDSTVLSVNIFSVTWVTSTLISSSLPDQVHPILMISIHIQSNEHSCWWHFMINNLTTSLNTSDIHKTLMTDKFTRWLLPTSSKTTKLFWHLERCAKQKHYPAHYRPGEGGRERVLWIPIFVRAHMFCGNNNFGVAHSSCWEESQHAPVRPGLADSKWSKVMGKGCFYLLMRSLPRAPNVCLAVCEQGAAVHWKTTLDTDAIRPGMERSEPRGDWSREQKTKGAEIAVSPLEVQLAVFNVFSC